MRKGLCLPVLLCLTAPGAIRAQVADPIEAPVIHRGLKARVETLTRLPETGSLHADDRDPATWARVSFVRDRADGRRFANDSRGFLYELRAGGEPTLYADVDAAFPHAIYDSLASGFIGFDFHPEFAANGLFYTVHGERAAGNPAVADFVPPGFGPSDVTYHSVITEWRATDPAAAAFDGSRRELLRIGHIVELFRHPFGYVGFNPTAEPGDPDYGLLYASGSDLGFSNGGGPHEADPAQMQRLDTVVGAILRIDPRSPSESGGVKGIGDYTVPAVNMYADDGDPETLGEIYASGFRNAHRLSWDLDDGTLFAADIGMSHIEEINIVHEGGNYGWMQREGYFDNGVSRRGGVLGDVFLLPSEVLNGRYPDGFAYPVAMYDHDDGEAVAAGFTYHGAIPALQGKFIFGDVARGRLFAADTAAMKAADDGVPETVAAIEEIQLYARDTDGNRRDVTMEDLVAEALGRDIERVDLHLSRSADGEIFITSRHDGYIRMLVPDRPADGAR